MVDDKYSISPEDKELWEQVMRDVETHKRNRRYTVSHHKTSVVPRIHKPALPEIRNVVTPYDVPLEKVMEKRQAKHIRQGKTSIDAKIDLHGFTEDKAHEALLRLIDKAYHHGRRCILVITGKGKGGQGILARRVPEWLGAAALRGKIISIAEALPQHGGSGALYVFLRRNK